MINIQACMMQDKANGCSLAMPVFCELSLHHGCGKQQPPAAVRMSSA